MLEHILTWGLAVAIVSLLFPLFTKKLRKSFADDIALSLQKAHGMALPKGQVAGQRVYVKTLSREALCVPLDAQTLAKMAQCVKVIRHEVQCVGLGCKMRAAAGQATAEVRITILFEGEMPNGESVSVNIQDAHLLAEFSIHEIHGWTLNSLREIKSPQSSDCAC